MDRRRIQPVFGKDVQPDKGLPEHIRRNLQDGVQEQGLDCEKPRGEHRGTDRHASIPGGQHLKHFGCQSGLVLDPWAKIGGVARAAWRQVEIRNAKPRNVSMTLRQPTSQFRLG